MKTKLLGRTGVSVSQLCFGTMSFGGDADEATSAAMYKNVRDAGINFFDTADEYSKGKSEEILGRLIKGHRDELVIASKCNSQQGPDVNARGTSRRHVVRAVEAEPEAARHRSPGYPVPAPLRRAHADRGSMRASRTWCAPAR